ncbi:MAG: CorA family divalent cation transporter [Candidatus Uhrbacteria bacterium]
MAHPTRKRGVQWINVKSVTLRRVVQLREQFKLLSERDLKECLPPLQRPKCVARDGYYFMVLLFPWFDRERHAVTTEEVDVFILKDTIITLHANHIPIFEELEAELRSGRSKDFFVDNSTNHVLDILERLLDYCAPIIVHLQNDIDEQEHFVQEHFKESEIIRTALLRRNVVSFGRGFSPNVHVLDQFRKESASHMSRDTKIRLDHIYDKAEEIAVLLADFASAISHIHETQQALVTHRTNRATTALSVVATLTFPLSMIAAVFGMGAIGTPLVQQENGFLIIALGLATLGIAMLAFFKWRRWF